MKEIIAQNFGGMKPMLSDLLLGPNRAKVAVNCDFLSGAVRPLNQNAQVSANEVKDGINHPTSDKGFIPLANGLYRIIDKPSKHILIRQETESDNRTLFLDAQGALCQTNNDGTKDVLFGSYGNMQERGLDLQPTLTRSGSTLSDNPLEYFYAISVVNKYGDESGLGRSASIKADVANSINVSLSGNQLTALRNHLKDVYGLGQMARVNELKLRLYRSSAGVFHLIHEQDETDFPTTSWSFRDTLADISKIGKAFDWATSRVDLPTRDLRGVIFHDNGFLIAYSDQTIYMSDPNNIAQFPEDLRINIHNKEIISLVEYLNRVLVFYQDDQHDVLEIAVPTQNDLGNLRSPESAYHCCSGDSVINIGNGVVFASREGLCVTDGYQTRLLDPELFDATSFSKFSPNTIRLYGGDHEFIMTNSGNIAYYFRRDMQMRQLSEKIFDAKWLNGKWVFIADSYGRSALEVGFADVTPRHMIWEGGEQTMDKPVTIRQAFVYGEYKTEEVGISSGLGTNEALGKSPFGMATSSIHKSGGSRKRQINLEVTCDGVPYRLPNPFKSNRPSGFKAAVGRKYRRYKFKIEGDGETNQIVLASRQKITAQIGYPA